MIYNHRHAISIANLTFCDNASSYQQFLFLHSRLKSPVNCYEKLHVSCLDAFIFVVVVAKRKMKTLVTIAVFIAFFFNLYLLNTLF